jgi:hypothetical protein
MITFILAALATGAAAGITAGAQDTVSSAFKDAYTALKSLIARKFANKPEAQVALAQHEKDPETWKMPLQKALTEVQADQDQDIVEAAKKLMTLAQAEGRAGGTSVIASGERSVALGGSMSGGSIMTGDSYKTPDEKD